MLFLQLMASKLLLLILIKQWLEVRDNNQQPLQVVNRVPRAFLQVIETQFEIMKTWMRPLTAILLPATLLLCAGLWCVAERRRLKLGTVLLVLSVLSRPDSVILIG